MTVTYDRVECYRSERVAKFFAERSNGTYIGVTATPGRLDLNNTFFNESTLIVREKIL